MKWNMGCGRSGSDGVLVTPYSLERDSLPVRENVGSQASLICSIRSVIERNGNHAAVCPVSGRRRFYSDRIRSDPYLLNDLYKDTTRLPTMAEPRSIFADFRGLITRPCLL